MAYWSKNNRACTTTWSTLMLLEQLDTVFREAGELKIKELTFFNQTSSGDQRKAAARTLAIQMDNVFREVRGATYEEDITGEQAIDSMLKVLTTPEATVSDLAEKCDISYNFYGEEDE
ncbi:hypothetical protein LOH54_09465 [Sulfurimonas sp. HSL-3221]|uniref:hypothetical protein n=1 Tax=Thiomicrolovo sulfuroxydans TaxID=2894755 RepID=UPI001E622FE9|nr:hypothetical protein [Sulfurimonas sp. HSL-3221]UFS61882.1 hypothetical protein LOH54_09465 [Sulfurimonas sp. HSL-3221]